MTAAPPLIELRGIEKSFIEAGRRRVVLDGVSCTIAHGELVVLLGRSGSGKSTLLNLIAGIDLPTAGEVLLEGRAYSTMTEDQRTIARRDRIGFVFQFFNLVPTLTVEENLLLPLDLAGGATKAGRERALALLAEVGLADRAGQFPDRLSGGEQQRVAVARALSADPALVLADEPTGNLDLETGLEVLELLDRLTRRAGKTMVMVTHSPEVMGLADRLLTLDHGKLVERPAAGMQPGSGPPST
ncbi:MAG: ABC transporter ATP-binding protein [Thermoanaerobaculia bacterium]